MVQVAFRQQDVKASEGHTTRELTT